MPKRNHSKVETKDDNDIDCKVLKSIDKTRSTTTSGSTTDRYKDIDTSYSNWKDIPKNKRTYIIHKPVGNEKILYQ
jgi:hypothetical protein